MRFLAAIAVAACLSGCGTYLYENGQPVLKMQSNAVNVTVRTASGTYFHADVIDNATPTLAAGQATSGVIGSAGLAVVGGLVAVPHPVPAVIATAIPATVGQAQGIVRPTNINISNQWIDPATGTRVKHKAKHRHRRHNAAPPKD